MHLKRFVSDLPSLITRIYKYISYITTFLASSYSSAANGQSESPSARLFADLASGGYGLFQGFQCWPCICEPRLPFFAFIAKERR